MCIIKKEERQKKEPTDKGQLSLSFLLPVDRHRSSVRIVVRITQISPHVNFTDLAGVEAMLYTRIQDQLYLVGIFVAFLSPSRQIRERIWIKSRLSPSKISSKSLFIILAFNTKLN
jgi:hypothetical protein